MDFIRARANKLNLFPSKGPWTFEEMEVAYAYWQREYPHKLADGDVRPFLQAPTPPGAWLTQARKALMITAKTVAQRMKISESAYAQIERRELTGGVSIKILKQCAEALDCDLVYAVVPRKKVEFSRVVWQEIYPRAMGSSRLLLCYPNKRCLALAAAAREISQKPGFRRRHESQPLR